MRNLTCGEFLRLTTTPRTLCPKQFFNRQVGLISLIVNLPEQMVIIPYIKGISEHIRRILAECDIQTRFRTTNTLQQLLSHPKNQTQMAKQSGVVYSIPCRDCTSLMVRQDNICQPGSHEESKGRQVCCIGTCLEQ